MKVRLSVQHRKANVKTVVLHSDAVIGRSTECNLRLASGQVSRKHCQLFIDDFRVAVMDLGSSNGTFLNGDQLQANVEVPLPPGAELEIGPVRFTVEYDDPSADTSIRRRTADSSASELQPEPSEIEPEPPEIVEQDVPAQPPPAEPPRRPLLVAKAARKKTEPEQKDEVDSLADTVQPESPPDPNATPAEAEAGQLFSPDVADAEEVEVQEADEMDSDDSDSSPNLEGSADETAEGFTLNFTPGGGPPPNDETLHIPPDSEEDAEEDFVAAENEHEEDEEKRPPDDNFMDFLKNLDD